MSRATEEQVHETMSPETWVDAHGDYLYRYALFRLGRKEGLEDLVQETLLAAWKGREQFAGQSSERTWLVGILRHKISDLMRRHGRETLMEHPEDALDPEADLYDERGHWHAPLGPWNGSPERIVENGQFWDTLRSCVAGLSPRLAHLFALREMENRSTEEICKLLDISPTNMWVMMHRARARIRRCLDCKWFGSGSKEA